mgnify:CR=1 FL=1|jgi:hypothetical protein
MISIDEIIPGIVVITLVFPSEIIIVKMIEDIWKPEP